MAERDGKGIAGPAPAIEDLLKGASMFKLKNRARPPTETC